MDNPRLVLLIEALAHRYHCDPWDVLSWDATRLGFNIMCYQMGANYAAALADRIAKNKGWVFPVQVIWDSAGGF